MQIVIDIPNYDLQAVKNGSIASKIILDAVKNGTVLPEHGNLVDMDELRKKHNIDVSEIATVILEATKGVDE